LRKRLAKLKSKLFDNRFIVVVVREKNQGWSPYANRSDYFNGTVDEMSESFYIFYSTAHHHRHPSTVRNDRSALKLALGASATGPAPTVAFALCIRGRVHGDRGARSSGVSGP
jgi:hypothetical protein